MPRRFIVIVDLSTTAYYAGMIHLLHQSAEDSHSNESRKHARNSSTYEILTGKHTRRTLIPGRSTSPRRREEDVS